MRMERIATDIFKISGAAISRTMLMLYGKIWIAVAVCVLLPMILLGIFHDVRWVIVSLMAIFIVFPMLLAFLFFYYGMNRVSVINATHHSLEFGSTGITAYIYNMEAKEKEPQYKLRSKTTIDYTSVSYYVAGVSNVILRTNLSGKGFLIIPLSAFTDKTLFVQAMEIISTGINKNYSNN